MSMTATFVQVDEAELSRLQAHPSLVEALFSRERVAQHIERVEHPRYIGGEGAFPPPAESRSSACFTSGPDHAIVMPL